MWLLGDVFEQLLASLDRLRLGLSLGEPCWGLSFGGLGGMFSAWLRPLLPEWLRRLLSEWLWRLLSVGLGCVLSD